MFKLQNRLISVNRTTHLCLISLLIILSNLPSLAQRELKFDIINQQNGLSANSVSIILQDSRGYLWLGTGDGLNKYDGVGIDVLQFSENNNFISSLFESRDSTLWIGIAGLGLVNYDPVKITSKVYEHQSSDSTSISGDRITFIHEDQDGNIWVRTNKGFDCLNMQTGEFQRFRANIEEGIASNDVTHFLEDKEGTIWVGTQQGTLKFKRRGRLSFDKISLSNGHQTVNEIFQDRNENIWIGTSSGLYALGDISDYVPMVKKWPTIDKVTAIWEDNLGSLWVSSDHTLWRFDRNSGLFKKQMGSSTSKILPALIDRRSSVFNAQHMHQYSAESSPVLVDTKNNFWMVTNEGLNMFDPATQLTKEIRVDDHFTNISSNQINNSMMDESGTLWFSTAGGGVCKFKDSRFYHYQYKKGVENTLGSAFVLDFHENLDGSIWVGTNGGSFSLFDPHSETFKRFKIPSSQSIVFDIVPMEREIWLATSGDGLVRYRMDDDQFTFYRHDPLKENTISSDNVQEIHIDDSGNFWVGTDDGLNLFDRATEAFKRIDLGGADKTQPDVFTIFQENSNLWLGTLGKGFILFNPRDHEQYTYFNSSLNGLPNNSITSICQDPFDNNLWMGTYGGGLVKFFILEEHFESYSQEDGLPNNVVYSIEEHSEHLWLSSNVGITKFEPKAGRVVANFDVDDGLQADEFNRGSHLKLSDGSMLFGGINGFNLFKPEEVGRATYSPRVHFKTFKLFGQESIDTKRSILSGEKRIELNYDENFFSIEFVTLDYRNPRRNLYNYRLSGLEENWNEVNNVNPAASYTNLDPGEYNFELRATNSDGEWLPGKEELLIVIDPPFWGTTQFRALVVILVISLIIMVHYYRIRFLRIRYKVLNKLVKERTKIINNQNTELSEKNVKLANTITQLKETQAKLIESEKMASLGVLSAGVAHEINNPLNFIRGGIQALKRRIDEKLGIDPESDKYVDIVNEGVDRTCTIVKSLGHFGRSTTDMTETCDLTFIIENCLVLMKAKMREGVRVVRKFESADYRIQGNEGRLHQAFLNLLSNAEQAIEGKGVITLEGKANEKMVEICISDEGAGIEPENLDHILDPFFTTKAPGKGTGLGLSITFNIIKEHNGEIGIHSELGKGTEVTISFPRGVSKANGRENHV